MAAPLAHLLGAFEKDAVFRDVLYGGGDGVAIPDAGRPFFLGSLAAALDRCVLAVVPTEADAEALRAATDRVRRPHGAASRVGRPAVRRPLARPAHLGAPARSAAPARARLRRRASSSRRRARSSQKPAPGAADLEPLHIDAKGTIDRDELARRLVELGYERDRHRGRARDVRRPRRRRRHLPRAGRPRRAHRAVRRRHRVDALRRPGDAAVGRRTRPASTVVARTELPPTPELRRRAEDAVERTGRTSYLEEVTDKLERFASGAVPEGAESLLPRVWDAERDGFGAILPRRHASSSSSTRRARRTRRRRRVEQEEELASLWADPARLPDDLHERPDAVRDEEGVLHLPFDRRPRRDPRRRT